MGGMDRMGRGDHSVRMYGLDRLDRTDNADRLQRGARDDPYHFYHTM